MHQQGARFRHAVGRALRAIGQLNITACQHIALGKAGLKRRKTKFFEGLYCLHQRRQYA